MMLRACLASLPGPSAANEVRRYGIRTATALAYLCDNTVCFLCAATVMHENLGAGGSERECARAPHTARSAGDECSFAVQTRHDHRPDCCCVCANSEEMLGFYTTSAIRLPP